MGKRFQLFVFIGFLLMPVYGGAKPVVLPNFGDLNCDDSIDVVDVQLAIVIALGQTLSSEIDGDGDGVPDLCQQEASAISGGCATGQVIQWNGTVWVCADAEPSASAFQDLQTIVDDLNTLLYGDNGDIEALIEDVLALETDVSSVQNEVAVLNTKVSDLESKVEMLENEQVPCTNVQLPIKDLDENVYVADGTGTNDSADAIQLHFNKAMKPGESGCVRFPTGTYLVSKTLFIKFANDYYCSNPPKLGPSGEKVARPFRVIGEHSVIKAVAVMDTILDIGISGSCLSIERLLLDGGGEVTFDGDAEPTIQDGFADHGIVGYKISGSLDEVSVQGVLSHGFVLTACTFGRFHRCVASRNGGDGWRILGANGSTFDQIRSVENIGNGITIGGGQDTEGNVFSGGCELQQVTVERNYGHGIMMGIFDEEGALELEENGEPLGDSIRATGGWLEANRLDGVRIYTNSSSVRHMRITAATPTPTSPKWTRAVRLMDTADACNVFGNFFANNGQSYQWTAKSLNDTSLPDHYGTVAYVDSSYSHYIEANHYTNGKPAAKKSFAECTPSFDCNECPWTANLWDPNYCPDCYECDMAEPGCQCSECYEEVCDQDPDPDDNIPPVCFCVVDPTP